MSYHKRYKPCVMIMAMNNVWIMLPFGKPVAKCYLESNESFSIIIIAIDLFPVKQAIDINQVKIKSKLIGFFPDNTIMKPMGSGGMTAFMHQFPLILVKEFGAVHRHYHFSYMTQLGLVLGY